MSLEGDAYKTCHVLQYESKLLSLEARRQRKKHTTSPATPRRRKTGKTQYRIKHNIAQNSSLLCKIGSSTVKHLCIFLAILRSKAFTIVNTKQWKWGSWWREARTTGKAGAHNVFGTHRPSAHPAKEASNWRTLSS